MPQASKTFRIFVSSTFSDLKAERNALQEHVFPRLRELCAKHGCRFQAIDLRWGIRDEAALDQQTMKICLDEIARCQRVTPRPNFIVLLANRYGWCPLPAEIPAEEFEEIEQQIASASKRTLLQQWYKRDDNALPPVYCLQRRAGIFESDSSWGPVERQLRDILVGATNNIALLDAELLKYTGSATEQEIVMGALNVPDAREHVFCFFRHCGPPERPVLALQDRLWRAVGSNVHEYQAEYTLAAELTTTHIGTLPKTLDECLRLNEEVRGSSTLCEDVWRELSRVILNEIARLESLNPLETELGEHDAFGTERGRHFVGRADFLRRISDYVGGTHPEPLVLFGSSGTGKTALMARAGADARRRFPGACVIARFVGATPASSDGRALLETLCHQISEQFDPGRGPLPSDYAGLAEELPERLAMATPQKPLVVFLDALDQLSNTNNERNLKWLPPHLPRNVRLIVSTTPGDCLTALERRLSGDSFIELRPMSVEDGAQVLDLWLRDSGRTLQDEQRREVLERFAGNGLPLYLKLAFEEARRWPSFRGPVTLAPDVPGIVRDMFRRLAEHHGEMIVSHGLGYLAAARNGLTEDELLDVLVQDEEFYADFKSHAHHDLPQMSTGERKLPVAVWSRLYFELEPYLIERSADGSSVLGFYHRQLGEAVAKEFLGRRDKQRRHAVLARYFAAQPTQTESAAAPNLRKLSELAYQQTNGEMWTDLESSLGSLEFVEAKCAAGMIYDLIADYRAALTCKGMSRETRERIAEFSGFVRRQSYVLADWPQAVFQQAANEPDETMPAEQARRRQDQGLEPRPWLRWVNKPDQSSACLMTLAGHTGEVEGCSYSLDGTKIFSNTSDEIKIWDAETGEEIATANIDHDVIQAWASSADGSKILSAGYCWKYRKRSLWLSFVEFFAFLLSFFSSRWLAKDFDRGRIPNVTLIDSDTGVQLKSIDGKWGGFIACGFTPDGIRVISKAGFTGTALEVTDADSGARLWTLSRRRRVTACAFSPDGTLIVSGSSGGETNVWSAASGRKLLTLREPKEAIEGCAFSPDGERVHSWTWGSINTWEVSTGALISTIETQTSVHALSPDGTRIVVVEDDPTFDVCDMRIRDSGNNRTLGVLPGAASCAFSPDGTRIVGSANKTLRVWDVARRLKSDSAPTHRGGIESCFFSPDGKRIITGCPEETILIWEGITGKKLAKVREQKESFMCCAISPDGSRIVSGYDTTLVFRDAETGKKQRGSLSGGHTDSIRFCAFSPDGSRILSADDRIVVLWDADNRAKLTTLSGHKDRISACGFSPDGTRAVSASGSKIKLWDGITGRHLLTLRGHQYSVEECLFSPDAARLLSSSFIEVKIWDLTNGSELPSPENGKSRGGFSPDGSSILCSGWDGVKLWCVNTQSFTTEFKGAPQGVKTAAFSPDGQWIAIGSDDNTLRIWDVRSGHRLCGYWVDAQCIQWSPDGMRLVAASGGAVHLLRLENLVPGPLIVTAWVSPNDGCAAVWCPLCRVWSRIERTALGEEVNCPHCRGNLRLNKFVIHAEWKQLAHARETRTALRESG